MGQSKIRDFSLLKGDFIFRNPALKNNSLLLVFVRTYILLISCSSKSFNSLAVM